MNKKNIIITVVVILLLIGGYFAFSALNRSRILSSGRIVVVTDRAAGFYSFSDLFDEGELERNFKIEGFYDSMSEDEFNQITGGLDLFIDAYFDPSDPRFRSPASPSSIVPGPGDQEKGPWLAAIETLTKEQSELCAQVFSALESQSCLSVHLVFNAFNSGQGSSVCDAIFADSQKKHCLQVFESGEPIGLRDFNNNKLVDDFEAYVYDLGSYQNDPLF